VRRVSSIRKKLPADSLERPFYVTPRTMNQTVLSLLVTSCVFYVSPLGKDSWNGTSPFYPFQTLQHALQVTPVTNGGVSILLERGSTFFVPSSIFVEGVGNMSTDGARFLLGSYGVAEERPLVSAAVVNQTGPLLWMQDARLFDVVGVEFWGGEISIALTIAGLVPQNIFDMNATIVDCVFRDARSVASFDSSDFQLGGAVILGGAHTISVAGLVLRNNIASACDAFVRSRLPTSYGHWTVATMTRFLVEGNFITRNYGNSLNLNWAEDTLATKNVFLRNGPPPGHVNLRGTTDIIFGIAPPSVNVSGNEVGWRGDGVGAPDGCALDFEVATKNVTVANNYFHHCWAAGFLIFGHNRTTSTGLILKDNILIENGCNQTSWDRGEVALTMHNSTGIFSGNVVVHHCNTSYITGHFPESVNGWVVVDNAVDGVNATLQVLPASSVSQVPAVEGGVWVEAQCTECPPGTVLRFTVDGSRPTITSPEWNGTARLQNRTVVVLVKAFPSPGSDASVIEGPAEGGIFTP
jgi:hypothetical protein